MATVRGEKRRLTVARYHFRATFRQRWAGYLSIVLLVGLVGGVAMGSIAGARRTQSTFPAYLAATNASNLQIQTSTVTNQFGTATLIGKLARLPHVQHVADAPYLLVIPLGPNGKALPSAFNDDDVTEVGSVGGMYFSQDRVTVTQGRMADPAQYGRNGGDRRGGSALRLASRPDRPIRCVLRPAGQYSHFQPADRGAAIRGSPPSSSASSCSRARSWTTTSIASRPPCS